VREQEQLLLVPASIVADIAGGDASWGYLNMRFDLGERLLVATGYWMKDSYSLPAAGSWLDDHYCRADVIGRSGLWYRVEPELHEWHQWLSRMGHDAVLDLSKFQEHVLSGWTVPGRSEWAVLTVFDGEGGPDLATWWVSAQGARTAACVQVDDRPPLSYVTEHWPVAELAGTKVTVVGLGSIGSAVADALAFYGVGELALIDYDRLLPHNIVRHQLTGRDIGRHKVNAVAEQLRRRWPGMTADPYPLDVSEHADVMRPLFADSDLVVCAADGVTARRVTNHLARRAGTPLVLACVLENGALGEVIRVRAGRGCLLCHRADLVKKGTLDPEPGLDRGYGEGTRHLPMTAIGGDLRLVADVAAKAAVATLLERKGHFAQRLPDDVFTVGLRPVPGLGEPFDLERSCATRWSSLPPPRPDCPTCGRQ
jgi:hypothetical protein